MSLTKVAVLSALVAGLAACATPSDTTDYEAEMDRLEADCRAKGGILQPTGAVTSNPGAEYACVVN